MNLEDVKVGDRVWLGQRTYAGGGGWRPINLHEVASVTTTGFRLVGRPKDLYKKATGADYTGAQYRIYAIATPDEISAWEAEQAQKKADAEAAEQARQQAYQEKCKRARVLFQSINLPVGMSLGIDNDVLTIEWDERKYRIEETDERE